MLSRILIFVSLLSLSISSMKIGLTTEMRVADLYINDWFSGMIFYRIFIGSLIYLSFIILFGSNNYVVKTLLILFSGLILSDTLWYILDNSHYLSLFIYPFQKPICYCALGALILGGLLFLKQKNHKKFRASMYYLMIVPAVALSLIKIVYIEDWTITASNTKKINLRKAITLLESNGVTIQNDELLMPFFSTSCGHCRSTAMKLSISHKNNTLPPLCIVFPGTEEKASQFLLETRLEGVNYIILPKERFIELAGTSLPSIFWITKNESTHYLGNRFNNIVLSEISK